MWENRIVGEGIERAGDLVANPRNWRIHPKHQQDALKGVLNEIGWVQRVIVNKRTGYVLDGHLRVSLVLAEQGDDAEVPVVYVDLSEDEEKALILAFDTITSLAGKDKDQVAELLEDIKQTDGKIMSFLERLHEDVLSFEEFDYDTLKPVVPKEEAKTKCPKCGFEW